jgi:SWI/SNF-related matrix-associated actin-dependent regulator of chromatin subfamily A member 5
LGYLKHIRKNTKPNIVIVPKSVIANWMNEVKRWCPTLRVLKFHGNKDERVRRTDLILTNVFRKKLKKRN